MIRNVHEVVPKIAEIAEIVEIWDRVQMGSEPAHSAAAGASVRPQGCRLHAPQGHSSAGGPHHFAYRSAPRPGDGNRVRQGRQLPPGARPLLPLAVGPVAAWRCHLESRQQGRLISPHKRANPPTMANLCPVFAIQQIRAWESGQVPRTISTEAEARVPHAAAVSELFDTSAARSSAIRITPKCLNQQWATNGGPPLPLTRRSS